MLGQERVSLFSARTFSVRTQPVLWFAAAGMVTAAIEAPAWADANAGRGKMLFQTCAACHSLDAKVNKVGPSLHGIFGRPSASIEGFLYSPAMKRANAVWTSSLLDQFIENP